MYLLDEMLNVSELLEKRKRLSWTTFGKVGKRPWKEGDQGGIRRSMRLLMSYG